MSLSDLLGRGDDCTKPDQCFAENGAPANNPKSPPTEPTCDEFERGFTCESKNLLGKLNWWFNRLSCAIKDLFVRVEALELLGDSDTIVGDYALTNPMDGDGILVLTAPVLDADGNSTGDTRTITLAEPAAPTTPETDGMHYSGVPTMDSNYIVTYPRVNDLDESPAPPVTLDLSALISSAHPTYNFAGDLTATANASGGFDVDYDDPDLIGAGGITTGQNAAGDWVITGAPTTSAADGYSLLETAVAGDTDIDGTPIPTGCTVTNFYNAAGTKIATHGHSIVSVLELGNVQFHNAITDQTGGGTVIDQTDTYNVLALAGSAVTNKMTVISATSLGLNAVATDVSSDDNVYATSWVNGLLQASSRNSTAPNNDRSWDSSSGIVVFVPQANGDFSYRHRHIYSNNGAGGSGIVMTKAYLQTLTVKEYI